MTSIIILGALATIAVAGTVLDVLRDGYRRKPRAEPRREYGRDEQYRAWRGAS